MCTLCPLLSLSRTELKTRSCKVTLWRFFGDTKAGDCPLVGTNGPFGPQCQEIENERDRVDERKGRGVSTFQRVWPCEAFVVKRPSIRISQLTNIGYAG